MNPKKQILFASFSMLFIVMTSGCSILTPNVSYPALNSNYKFLIGSKIEVIAPLQIDWSYGEKLYFINYQASDGKKIVDVPIGTILTINHISRRYSLEYGYWDYVIARVNVEGFKGGVVIEMFQEGSKFNDSWLDNKKFKLLEGPKGR